jgi:hypothetical protein
MNRVWYWMKNKGAWVGGVILLILVAMFWQAVQKAPLNLTKPVKITSQGIAVQDEVRIGIVRSTHAGQTIRIPLIDPKTTQEPTSYGQFIHFDTPNAKSAITPIFISIQGTGGMEAEWASDQDLYVVIDYGVPDAYIALDLFTPDTFFHPTFFNRIVDGLLSFNLVWGIILGLVLFILIALFVRLRTRQPEWKATGISHSPPEGLSPIELAIVHHSTVRPMDLLALIYELAERGFVQIVDQRGEALFIRTKKETDLTPYEQGLLAILFPSTNGVPVKMSDILASLNQELFSAVVSQYYINLYAAFTTKGYFRDNPRFIHLRYKTAGIIFQFIGLLLAVLGAFSLNAEIPGSLPLGIGVYLSGMLLYQAGYRVVPLSANGRIFLTECANFMAYLTHESPIGVEGVQGYLFYKLLPYALVTDTAPYWFRRFAQIRWYVPDWYSTDAAIFTPEEFLVQIDKTVDTFAHLMVTVKDPNAD